MSNKAKCKKQSVNYFSMFGHHKFCISHNVIDTYLAMYIIVIIILQLLLLITNKDVFIVLAVVNM